MKIALFHHFLDNIGGAEIVTLELARGLNADVYTTNISIDKITKMGYADVLPRIKSIGRVPINAPYRHQLALFRFRFLDVKKRFKKKYDRFIISGDWAVGGAVHNKPNLWYVHSPLNELFAFRKYIRNEILPSWQKIPYDMFVVYNRYLVRKYAKHVDTWVCNSRNTQKRIKTYFEVNATIIHPPIDCAKYTWKADKGYWLSVNRLITHKRIELQMKTFAKLPDEKLIVVGSYEKKAKHFEEYKKYIESIKPANVEIRAWVSDTELKKLYSECKGFIATARDEDFGMTPIEAMACGKPVVAVNEGGYKESVVDGKTGLLVDSNIKTFIEAIKNVDTNSPHYKKDCLKRAKQFDLDVFIKKIKLEIK